MCMSICSCIHMYLYIYSWVYIYIYIYICVRIYRYSCVCVCVCMYMHMCTYIEYTFFNLEIINPKNMNKNIPEISDQNRINIEVTLLYFSTYQLKTQNKNILENLAEKLINRKNFGAKINK